MSRISWCRDTKIRRYSSSRLISEVSPFDNVCDEERELDVKLEKRKRELVEVG